LHAQNVALTRCCLQHHHITLWRETCKHLLWRGTFSKTNIEFRHYEKKKEWQKFEYLL